MIKGVRWKDKWTYFVTITMLDNDDFRDEHVRWE